MNIRDITVNYFPPLKRKLSDNNLAINYIDITQQHLIAELIYPFLVKRIQRKEITDIHINYLLELYNNIDENIVNVFWVSIIESILANCNKDDIYYLINKLPKDLKVEIIEFNNCMFTTKLQ